MVSFDFTIENQTEEDYSLNLINITPAVTQYNPQPDQTIDDGEDDNFAIAVAGDDLASTLLYRLDDDGGHEVGTYNFIVRFHNGQLIHDETYSEGLDVFVSVQNQGDNNFEIDITCQLEAAD